MKVGDLVTLSTAGSKQQQNWKPKRTKFGMVVEAKGTWPSNSKPLFIVDWFVPKDMQYLWGSTHRQGHWRYEIKKFKKSNKKA
jgi:hypothetical protein